MFLVLLTIAICTLLGLAAAALARFMAYVWPLDPAEYLRRTPRPFDYL